MKNAWMAVGIVALAVGCGGSAETSKEFSADDAKARAIALLPGSTVVGVERETPVDEPALIIVKLKMANGAAVDAEYVAADGSLFELKSEAAPFDGYEITPRAGVLRYSQARSKALETKPGTLEVWEFQAVKSVWEFYVRDNTMKLWEIKMAAVDGKVTSVVEKVQPD
jgi:hypothetical protein